MSIEELFSFVWCVEYPYRAPWKMFFIKKYFKSEELAQKFIDNYSDFSKEEFGPSRIYAAQTFITNIIKILVVTINNDIYSIGQPIKLE